MANIPCPWTQKGPSIIEILKYIYIEILVQRLELHSIPYYLIPIFVTISKATSGSILMVKIALKVDN